MRREAGNLKGMPPDKVVELTASSFARMFKDYAVAEGPLVAKVSGHAAGYTPITMFCGVARLSQPV